MNMSASLPASVLIHLAKTPQQICYTLLQRGGTTTPLSYADLCRGALDYAGRYQAAGMRSGQTVLIALRQSEQLVFAFWGALFAGLVPSIIAPLANRQRPAAYADSLRHLLNLCDEARVIADSTQLAEFVALAGVDVTRFVDIASVVAPPLGQPYAAAPDEVAFLQFSSGTTGHRKGVVFTHARVQAQMRALAAVLQFPPHACIASWLPLYHDMGLIACFIAPLLLGVPVVMVDALDWVAEPFMLLQAIEKYRVTHVWLPNFAFNHLAQTVRQEELAELSSVQAWINCSEPCKPATFEAFLQRFGSMGVRREQLQTCYAMAETVFAVTHTPLGQAVAAAADGRVLSAGVPVPGMAVQIVDAAGQVVPAQQVGEIQVSGECVMAHYYRDPERDREAFAAGWFRTGDLGYMQDGQLYVSGRSKDVIIVNGRNVFAHEVEGIASCLAGVKPGRVLALGIENPHSGSEDLVILAEVSDASVETRLLQRAIKSAVVESLGLSVSRVVPLEAGWLIKTTSGKMDRQRNRQRYMEEHNA